MKKTKYLNKALLGIISTLGFGGAITSATILANTSTNVDKLELLNRAVQDNTVEQLQSKRSDIVVELGGNYSAALINGTLYTWGWNSDGQLGLGDVINRNVPTQVAQTSNGAIIPGTVTQIALGYYHSAAVIDGALYTWGLNSSGELGLGDTNRRNIPTQVTDTSNEIITSGAVTQIALGAYHSTAVIDGALYTWGYNSYGQLGLGDRNRRTIPTQVTRTDNQSIAAGTVTQIALGYNYSAAIIDHALYTWGTNDYGQLGLGDTNQTIIPTQVKSTSNGTIVAGTVTQIVLGDSHSAAVINDTLYTWGTNEFGQLGLGNSGSGTNRHTPTQVTNTNNGTIVAGTVTQIALGESHSTAVIDGALYTWGHNAYGQLGLGNSTSKNTPTHVTSTANGAIVAGTVTQIILGRYHSAAVINGTLYTWGLNSSGQLGLGNTNNKYILTSGTTLEIIQKATINLDSTNDKINIRNKIIYNVTINDIETLLNQQPSIIPGLSSSSIINIAFKSKVGITSIGSNNVGQIIVILTTDSKYFEITFNGFKPVNRTQDIIISQKSLPLNETSFANDEIYQLVVNANADTTGRNNKIATWIINNSLFFIGNTTNEYTQDFPKDTKITKVSDVRVANASTGTLSFKIDVDKYYKPSTPSINLIESTSSDPNITLTSPITLSGFRKTTESNPTVITTSNRDISSADLKQLFGYVNDATNITGNGLVKLKEYIDLTGFPPNTNFKIIDPQSNGTTELSFQIEVSQYFDANAILQNSARTFARLTINNLKNVKSMLVQNTNYNKLTANDILKYIGYDSTNPTAPLNNTRLFDYFTASNPFPANVQFRLASAPIISNDNIELTLSIEANSWFDVDGSIQTNTQTYGPFVFSELRIIFNPSTKDENSTHTIILVTTIVGSSVLLILLILLLIHKKNSLITDYLINKPKNKKHLEKSKEESTKIS